jgi:glutamate transport system substrate-binding protein
MEQSGYAECVTALISGTVDAVTTDDIILAGLAAAKGDGQLKVVGKPFTQERYGIGVKKGDTTLVKKINAALKEMEEDGSWQKALDSATKGTGYKANSKYNPPTAFDAASSTQDF